MTTETIFELRLDDLHEGPVNPRRSFDQVALEETWSARFARERVGLADLRSNRMLTVPSVIIGEEDNVLINPRAP